MSPGGIATRRSVFPIVPIGKPIANTQMHILNTNLRPLPIGEIGELYIGGVQVARGYLNRPELAPNVLSVIHSANAPTLGSTKPATWHATCPMATSTSWGASTIRSSCTVSASNWARSDRFWRNIHLCIRRLSSCTSSRRPMTKGQASNWLPTLCSSRVLHLLPAPPNCVAICSREKVPIYGTQPLCAAARNAAFPNGKLDYKLLPAPSRQRPALEQPFAAPRNAVERWLATLWCEILQLDAVGIHDRFFELGGDSIQSAQFVNRLQKELGEFIYIVTIFDAPTIADYAALLEQRDYATALNQRFGRSVSTQKNGAIGSIDNNLLARFKACIPYLPASNQPTTVAPKNRRAIFVLAPPRSGTTLLRVMLAGHPQLFAATELQLLGFNNLHERRNAYCGKFSLWLEGTLRAIMEIKGCSAEEAKQLMSDYEAQGLTTQQFYALLQSWIGERILVDKSPSYVLDPEALHKAEADFDETFYIHLVRHPYPMVRSFESYHMDQVLYLKEHNFAPRQLGELVWLASHNTLDFLSKIPAQRQLRISFETLVSQPRTVMEDFCQQMIIPFHPDLINPYHEIEKKMVNGIYAIEPDRQYTVARTADNRPQGCRSMEGGCQRQFPERNNLGCGATAWLRKANSSHHPRRAE